MTLWTVGCQLPLSMGFSRQEYWSELPCPPPGNLPDPGTERASPALAGGFFTTSTMWEAPKHFIPGLFEILIFALWSRLLLIISILQMGKQRHSTYRACWSLTANKWPSQDLNPGLLGPESMVSGMLAKTETQLPHCFGSFWGLAVVGLLQQRLRSPTFPRSFLIRCLWSLQTPVTPSYHWTEFPPRIYLSCMSLFSRKLWWPVSLVSWVIFRLLGRILEIQWNCLLTHVWWGK